MNTAEKSKYPVAIFELIPASSNGAGFVREDTAGSNNPITLIHPKNRVIMSESVVTKEIDDETNPGKKIHINVPIRYIYGQPIIDKAEQEKRGLQTNPKTDKILFKNGLLTVPKNGAFVGLYNIMMAHAQNATNPNRPMDEDGSPQFQAIFSEIKPAENAQQSSINDFQVSEAVMYIRALVTEKGGKYQYNEERIDALAAQFNVYGETVEERTTALVAYAKVNPLDFLTKAKESEQTMLIEVQHGLKLKLITFEGNSAVYVEPAEKIKTFTGRLAEDKKAQALVNYFSVVEGKEAYQLFQARLEATKSALAERN